MRWSLNARILSVSQSLGVILWKILLNKHAHKDRNTRTQMFFFLLWSNGSQPSKTTHKNKPQNRLINNARGRRTLFSDNNNTNNKKQNAKKWKAPRFSSPLFFSLSFSLSFPLFSSLSLFLSFTYTHTHCGREAFIINFISYKIQRGKFPFCPHFPSTEAM